MFVRSHSVQRKKKNLKNPTTVTLFDYLTSTYLFIFLLYLINDFIYLQLFNTREVLEVRHYVNKDKIN